MQTLHHPTPIRKLAEIAIYQPTETEIDSVLNEAIGNYPELTERIERARQILRNHDIGIVPRHWQLGVVWFRVGGQHVRDSHYVVYGNTMRCMCPDRTFHQADTIGDVVFCKHTIAVAAYRRILRLRLNKAIRAFDVELAMLDTGQLRAYAPQLRDVIVVRDDDRGDYRFADAFSTVNFATWLYRVEEIRRLARPVVEAVELQLAAD